MVEATQDSQFQHQYAKLRTDKEPTPGYSAELLNVKVDPQYYDDLGSMPIEVPGIETIIQVFERNVAEIPNSEFLGQRILQEDGSMSPFYVWKTVAEIDKKAKSLARGMMAGEYAPEVDGETEG